MVKNCVNWRGCTFRGGSLPSGATMAGGWDFGTGGAPIEKARPLSLLNMTPIRLMERSEKSGDVRAGQGATPSACALWAGWVFCTRTVLFKIRVARCRRTRTICGDGRVGTARGTGHGARHERNFCDWARVRSPLLSVVRGIAVRRVLKTKIQGHFPY